MSPLFLILKGNCAVLHTPERKCKLLSVRLSLLNHGYKLGTATALLSGQVVALWVKAELPPFPVATHPLLPLFCAPS